METKSRKKRLDEIDRRIVVLESAVDEVLGHVEKSIGRVEKMVNAIKKKFGIT